MRALNISLDELVAAALDPSGREELVSRITSRLPVEVVTASGPSAGETDPSEGVSAHLKRARALYEKEKVSPPYPYVPRTFLLQTFALSREKAEEEEKRASDKDMVRTLSTTLGVPIHVSRVTLKDLKPGMLCFSSLSMHSPSWGIVHLSSMSVRKVHKGSRVVSPRIMGNNMRFFL